MEIIQETAMPLTIGQMVANNFRTADVFKKYKIDFCCKGNRQLADVCEERGLDYGRIEEELAAKIIARESTNIASFSDMELDELADVICSTHHIYVRESIPVLLAYLTKVNKVHGKNHPELNEILMQFIQCSDELMQHMLKEETILFPSIKRLAAANRTANEINAPFFFGPMSNPINTMQDEHSVEGERVARMTELTNNFTPPDDACTTYRVAYQKLDEFINDLYTHIHLENNILFPNALLLERKVVNLTS